MKDSRILFYTPKRNTARYIYITSSNVEKNDQSRFLCVNAHNKAQWQQLLQNLREIEQISICIFAREPHDMWKNFCVVFINLGSLRIARRDENIWKFNSFAPPPRLLRWHIDFKPPPPPFCAYYFFLTW